MLCKTLKKNNSVVTAVTHRSLSSSIRSCSACSAARRNFSFFESFFLGT